MQAAADSGEGTDLEALCSQLTLDVIGKAVFNYDFDSLTTNSPLIQVKHHRQQHWNPLPGDTGPDQPTS